MHLSRFFPPYFLEGFNSYSEILYISTCAPTALDLFKVYVFHVPKRKVDFQSLSFESRDLLFRDNMFVFLTF